MIRRSHLSYKPVYTRERAKTPSSKYFNKVKASDYSMFNKKQRAGVKYTPNHGNHPLFEFSHTGYCESAINKWNL